MVEQPNWPSKVPGKKSGDGRDISPPTEIDINSIEDFREYPDKPNYCEVEVWVNGKLVSYPINESQKDFRKRFKHFSTRKELECDAIGADFSYDTGDM